MADLGDGIYNATDETDEDGGDTAEGDGRVEEDETADSNRKLVERTDHGVGGGRGDTDTPGGGVGYEDRAHAGDDHDHNHTVAKLGREALGEVGGRPIFNEERSDKEDRNGEQVVVVHG